MNAAPAGELSYATARLEETASFVSHDGITLFYRHWPTSGRPRGAVLLFHRGHEHSGRMAHLADELECPDYAVFAWDARGHGHSRHGSESAPGVETFVRDIQTFVDHIARQHDIAVEDMAVVAQSVGAVFVAAWVHDYAPKIRALVLASPAFKVRLYVPFARTALGIMHRLRGDFPVNSYVKAAYLTHDPERRASYGRDPLITRPIAVKVLLDLYGLADRIVADARAITVPTQLLVSGADWVVEAAPQHRFFENLGSPVKERHVLPGLYHDTLGERDRALVVAKMRSFILDGFSMRPDRSEQLNAHRVGYTRDEAERLASPLAPLSLRGLYWAAARANIKLGSLVSEGIRLGRLTGFDSGSTLDYVYRNEARGLGPGGRLIDRSYLNSVGWRGIRVRKTHLEELIRAAMDRLRQDALPVRILDIAAGHGRYVLDAVASAAIKPDFISLRDYDAANVAAGSRLIAERGLTETAVFRQDDAFDEESIATAEPKPTLGIVSGLYELFADNPPVRRSLAGLARAIAPGGYLIYTGQPWHPQLEFIARTLTSHRGGAAWIMRRRTQAEMDTLVETAGFRKLEQRVDPWGIFTVSLARRTAELPERTAT